MAGKVWVIESDAQGETRRAEEGSASSRRLGVPTERSRRPNRSYRNWLPVLATCLLGPLALVRGKHRSLLWPSLGLLGLAGAGAFIGFRYPISAWIAATPEALGIVTAGAAVVVLLLSASWGVAVGGVARRHPVLLPGWARHPLLMGTLGLVLPGLGLLVAGRARSAAAAGAVAIVGIASLALVAGTLEIWSATRASGGATPLLEVVLLGSAAIGGLCGLLWILLALEGARAPAAKSGPGGGQALAGALLAALALAAFVSPAQPLAGCIHRAATRLRADGMRVAPLLLCQTAARLDPACPEYLADTAELNDALGRPEAAHEARERLRRRAAEYRDLPLTLRYPAQLTSIATTSGPDPDRFFSAPPE
jgi:hypothetical protein